MYEYAVGSMPGWTTKSPRIVNRPDREHAGLIILLPEKRLAKCKVRNPVKNLLYLIMSTLCMNMNGGVSSSSSSAVIHILKKRKKTEEQYESIMNFSP